VHGDRVYFGIIGHGITHLSKLKGVVQAPARVMLALKLKQN
jgi:hypothetical protein